MSSLFDSIDKQLFERIALCLKPEYAQKMCMLNRKYRAWTDKHFYGRLLKHYFNIEASEDAKLDFCPSYI